MSESLKARFALQANLSDRYRRLDRLEAYVKGTQYDGMPSFHETEKPMYDRAPCVVYPIVASAIRSNVDLCQWPTITSGTSEDDSEFDESGLSETESETLDRFVESVVKQSRLKQKCRELLASAQSCGTAVAICSIRKGRIVVDTTKAKWCVPEFVQTDPSKLAALEIRYPYLEEYRDKHTNSVELRCMLYRRRIDDVSDVTFLPMRADDKGGEPAPEDWKIDPSKTFDHGLGFCPAVWHKHAAECSTVNQIDGEAIHATLLDEVDALNYGLSQRHVAAMVSASPPVIETGVEYDHNPSAMGVEPGSVYVQGDHDSMMRWRAVQSGSGKPARKRGPGVIWRYPNPDTKVGHLTMAAGALEPIDNDCRDLRAKIAEALSVVFTDPENMRSAADMSGRALREHHKRQTERCDTIRDDFGDGMILPLVEMLLRMCHVVVSVGKAARMRIPGLLVAAPILSKGASVVANDDGSASEEWEAPQLSLVWPDYFSVSEAEVAAVIESTIKAKDAGLITLKTAIGRIKQFFGICNVDQYEDALEQLGAEYGSASDMAEKRDTIPAPALEDDEDESEAA